MFCKLLLVNNLRTGLQVRTCKSYTSFSSSLFPKGMGEGGHYSLFHYQKGWGKVVIIHYFIIKRDGGRWSLFIISLSKGMGEGGHYS